MKTQIDPTNGVLLSGDRGAKYSRGRKCLTPQQGVYTSVICAPQQSGFAYYQQSIFSAASRSFRIILSTPTLSGVL